MKFFTQTAMAMIAAMIVLPLGACEHMSGDDTNNDVRVTSNTNEANDRLSNAPGVRPVPQFPPPSDRDLRTMTTKLSGGAVEIYDTDGGMSGGMGAGVPSVQQDYAGIPLATDPNVTIYPIDGYNDYPGGLGGNQWAATSPMPVTPAPLSYGGGDASSYAGSGKSSIYFPYGSAQLDRNDRSVLSGVAEAAKFAPVDRVSVEGHASPRTQTSDPIKSRILNLKESTNRAVAVSQELIQKGVPAEKIKTVGWGDTKPSGGGEDAERRVDIYTGQ